MVEVINSKKEIFQGNFILVILNGENYRGWLEKS